MLKFISPIVIEENFLLKENQQNFYVEKINKELFDKIVVSMYHYMQSLPLEGLKCYMHKNETCYHKITNIVIRPILQNKKLYCETIIGNSVPLTNIDKGILKDYLQDVFAEQVNTYMIIHDIEYIPDIDYYNGIKENLQQQNLKYTIKLNFFDYNKFTIEGVE